MKELIQRIWMPVLGIISTLGFKQINDKTILSPDIAETVQHVTNYAVNEGHSSLLVYFWIGMLGAAGGLVLKIIWSLIKKWFPKLKNIDK
jgi:hypothetical protein